MMFFFFIGSKVATRLLLPKPSAGNITVTNLIRYPIVNMITMMTKTMIDVLNTL